MTQILILYFLLLEINQKCYANDTLKVTQHIGLEKIGWEYAPGYLLIEHKDFTLGYTPNNGFFTHLSYPHNEYSQVYFRNCSFGVFQTDAMMPPPSANAGFYVIDSCIINLLPIVNMSGDLRINSTQLKYLSVNNTNNLSLSLFGDSLLTFLLLDSNRNLKFQLGQCAFSDSGELRIINSTLTEFSFIYNETSGCNIEFNRDTINSFMGLARSDDLNEKHNSKSYYNHQNIFTFSNCYVNADFVFFEQIPNATIIFNNCTFGPETYLGNMSVNKLVFRDCRNISDQLLIGFTEGTEKMEIGLRNSDVTNMKFNFNEDTKFVFDSTDTRDDITNTYKSLLEKFEEGGQERNYKIVDLQYRKYSQSRFWHFINAIWWYHGYKPSLVFAWTAFFLLLFFCFNLRYWIPMHETYKMFGEKEATIKNEKGRKWEFYHTVLIYTILIFFSLRISFDKLKLKSFPLVYYFLFQYLIGLWCLLFIIRYIFKL